MNAPAPKRPLVHWVDLVALLAFGVLMFVVLLQFFTRYVLNDSVGWTEEMARYLLVATAYAGSASALLRGGHVFLEATYRLSPPANARPMALFTELLGACYHGLLALLALELALETEQRMVSVDAPKSLVYAFVAASLAVSTVHGGIRTARRLRQTSAEVLEEIERSATREGGA